MADATVLTPEQANPILAEAGARPVGSSQRVSELAQRPGIA